VSLEYAILGFLNYQPFTGYDLKKLFDRSVRHFWSADQSQIYRTLAHLTEEGKAEIEVVEQTDRPDRKVYHITPRGREAFMEWLGGPFPSDDPKSSPLVQVFFAGRLTNEQILEKFKVAREIFLAILETYEKVPAQIDEYVEMVKSPREQYFWFLTLDLGIRNMRTQLAWVEEVIETIESGGLPQE